MIAPASSSPTATFPAPKIAPNAWHAFGGIWRLTFRRFLGPTQLLSLLALVSLLGLLAYAIVRDGRAKFYFEWTTGFYLTFLIPILAFLSGAGALRDELKSATVDYVLTRPVRRPAFLIFKFLSHLVCAQASYLLTLGVIIVVGNIRHIPGVFNALPWLLLGQFVCVTAFTAFGFLCSIITARYLVIGLAYAGVIEAGMGNIPTQLNRVSMIHQVRMLLQPVLSSTSPDIRVEQPALLCVFVLLSVSTVMLAIAGIVFSYREFAGVRTGES